MNQELLTYHCGANCNISLCINCKKPVCPSHRTAWASFENLLKDMKDMRPQPSSTRTIDRKKNHLGYSKTNCRWATRFEQ